MPRSQRVPDVLQLRMVVEDIEPPIWREILVPADLSLHGLHRAIQVLMGWYDYHLYEFEIAGTRYEAPDPEAEGKDATRIKLSRLALGVRYRFEYRYDFGDSWRVAITVTDQQAGGPEYFLPEVLGGERSRPHEDCGGVGGYERLVEALANPDHPENQELVNWAGSDFDSEDFSAKSAEHALMLMVGWGAIR